MSRMVELIVPIEGSDSDSVWINSDYIIGVRGFDYEQGMPYRVVIDGMGELECLGHHSDLLAAIAGSPGEIPRGEAEQKLPRPTPRRR